MKRRTGLLFTSAVVVGLLGGTGTGWAIQRQRPATPLPPLATTVGTRVLAGAPAGAASQSPDPSTDDGAKLDGDLRKLLLDKPADATDSAFTQPVHWLSVRDLAEVSRRPERQFAELNQRGFRRAAARLWDAKDGTTVDVELTQFRTGSGAADYYGAGIGGEKGAVKIVGTLTGYAVAAPSRDQDGQYWGEAIAMHGTVIVAVYVYSPVKPVDPNGIARIAAEQLGKL